MQLSATIKYFYRFYMHSENKPAFGTSIGRLILGISKSRSKITIRVFGEELLSDHKILEFYTSV